MKIPHPNFSAVSEAATPRIGRLRSINTTFVKPKPRFVSQRRGFEKTSFLRGRIISIMDTLKRTIRKHAKRTEDSQSIATVSKSIYSASLGLKFSGSKSPNLAT